MKYEEFIHLEDEERFKYVAHLACEVAKRLGKTLMGVGFDINSEEISIVVKVRYIYKNLENYEKLINELKKIKEEEEFDKVFLDFDEDVVSIEFIVTKR